MLFPVFAAFVIFYLCSGAFVGGIAYYISKQSHTWRTIESEALFCVVIFWPMALCAALGIYLVKRGLPGKGKHK